MIEAYQHIFGEYPFKKTDYKLIGRALFAGMEHQSAVPTAIICNGYLERIGRAVGISPRL